MRKKRKEGDWLLVKEEDEVHIESAREREEEMME